MTALAPSLIFMLAARFVVGIGCALMLLFFSVTSILLLAASLGFLGFGLGANATIFMKVVLSGISTEKAGAATGTYGLFRDLAAPFGVAVFVPLFTNRVTLSIGMGMDSISAAVDSLKLLAVTEIVCVAARLLAVALLPEIHSKKENG